MTQYKEVYDGFKDKITDPELLLYTQDIQDEILLNLLKVSCSRFKRVCKTDLSNRDDNSLQFNNTLDEEIVDILTEIMVELWLKPYLNNIENFRNKLSTNDFKTFSSADLLRAIQNRYSLAVKQSKSMINNYSFLNSDLEELKS